MHIIIIIIITNLNQSYAPMNGSISSGYTEDTGAAQVLDGGKKKMNGTKLRFNARVQ